MDILISAVMILAMSNEPMPPILITEEQRRQFDEIGTCIRGDQSFDMRRAMFLEDRPVDVDSPNGPLRLSIEGESLGVAPAGPGPTISPSYLDIDSRVDATQDLDIELKFAYLDGQLVLYWKETFRNRHYRQGLFTVAGGTLTLLCEGVGGRHVER